MSSYLFECVVVEKVDEAEDFFLLLKDASWGRTPESQRKIKQLLHKADEYILPLIRFDLRRNSTSLYFGVEGAPSFGFDFFSGIARVLDSIDGINYKANFFDSSSGGSYEWRKPGSNADKGR